MHTDESTLPGSRKIKSIRWRVCTRIFKDGSN